MGDRANVAIYASEKDLPVVLYTHWGGHELAQDVADAIARQQRWDDPSYLARIIFCEMMPVNQHEEETGFGISVGCLCDNEHPIIFVDMIRLVVGFLAEPADQYLPTYENLPAAFTDFVSLANKPKDFIQTYARMDRHGELWPSEEK